MQTTGTADHAEVAIMSAYDSDAILGDFSGEMLGFGTFDEPPDRVPLRILGLSELPIDEAQLRRAFVRKVRKLHPDLNPLDESSWREVQADGWDEVQWARAVLKRKIDRVTAKSDPVGNLVTRHTGPGKSWCRGCERPFGLFRRGGVGWKRDGLCYRCAHEEDLKAARERRRAHRANRSCPQCGAIFTPSRSDGRYCKPACRQRAYRERSRSRP